MNNKTIAMVLGAIMLFGGVGYWYLYSMGWLPHPDGGGNPVIPPPVMVSVRAVWGTTAGQAFAGVRVNASSVFEDDFCISASSGDDPKIPLRPTVAYSFVITTYFLGDPNNIMIGQLNATLTMPSGLSASSMVVIGCDVIVTGSKVVPKTITVMP